MKTRQYNKISVIRNSTEQYFAGYFAAVKYLEEVREEVLRYIKFLARPEVEDVNERSLTWSHMFVDVTVSLNLEIIPLRF